ncbi:uncharacterized protein LOC135135633 [Zophobas morio]|uniref:uncharacterized protein LOC135135633 n=1 Tax=Zophobas morio TaxID=2755281 RepID=UPI003083010C
MDGWMDGGLGVSCRSAATPLTRLTRKKSLGFDSGATSYVTPTQLVFKSVAIKFCPEHLAHGCSDWRVVTSEQQEKKHKKKRTNTTHTTPVKSSRGSTADPTSHIAVAEGQRPAARSKTPARSSAASSTGVKGQIPFSFIRTISASVQVLIVDAESDSEGETANLLRSWINKRNQIVSELDRILEFVRNFPSGSNIGLIIARRPIALNAINDFKEVQFKIEENVPPALLDDEVDHRINFEAKYYETIAEIDTIIKNEGNSKHTSINNRENPTPKITLPALKLPEFSGSYSDWTSFRDTFKSVIHENSSLSNIEKFHYLRSTLKGEAFRAIESLSPVNVNYEIAWDLLNKRFQNKRLIIVHEHIKNILDAPAVTRANQENLRQLSDLLCANIAALKAFEIPVDQWDSILTTIIVDKLDYQTKREWQSKLTDDIPKLAELFKLIDARCQILESTAHINASPRPKHYNIKGTVSHFTAKRTCLVCKRPNHNLYSCNEFLKMSLEERIKKVTSLKLCNNCLKPNHICIECRSNSSCKYCKQKHNSLLHRMEIQQVLPEPHVGTSTSNHTSNYNLSETLLSTAIIYIWDNFGKMHKCRALLDGGSQSNFITRDLCQKLRLKTQSTNHITTGVNLSSNRVNETVQVHLSSLFKESLHYNIDCLVLNKITQNLPLNSFSTKGMVIPDFVNLADANFNICGEIDILLGARMFFQVLRDGKIQIGNSLYLHNTDFGWIIGGSINTTNFMSLSTCNTNTLQALNDQVLDFFQLEGLAGSPTNKILSPEEKSCEKQFVDKHKRTDLGNFVVDLPFKNKSIMLGHSETMARNRFFTLERKLLKNMELRHQYIQFMREYEQLGHMQLVSDISSENSYFIPHHAVIKNTTQGNKLRVVFDASMTSSNGHSLNDNLLIGPNLQQELFLILLKFRTYKYVISADIEKMYRQIFLTENHQQFQRIFWRENVSDPLQIYQLKTVTYGTASAPYLAMRCLKQLALENMNVLPVAASNILNNFYMDDLICGSSTLEEALALRDDIIQILNQGNFKLHKWASNEPTLLPESDIKASVNFSSDTETKTLGLIWNCHKDQLKYNLALNRLPSKTTKRTILATVATIFDPVGLITPVILKAKLLLQSLWAAQIGWDDPIPSDLEYHWNQFLINLPDVKNIEISRHIFRNDTPNIVELHGFADASTKGFGAAIYIKTILSSAETHTQLLCAKSRVAPLKTISLPRLELSAALLLARLISKILPELNLKINKCFLWTDSTIVLNWIAASPHNWQTFVANRVSEIQTLTSGHNWRHINGTDNPADLITRGLFPKQLINCKLWWFGPEWLSKPPTDWPQTIIDLGTEVPERQKTLITSTCTTFKSDLLMRFSDFTKLKRTVAWIKRFVSNCRNKRLNKELKSGLLTIEELDDANRIIITLVQRESFQKEIVILKSGKELPTNNSLLCLSPFLDSNNILRVGGRLRNAVLAYDRKHQIILPKKHYVTELLIRQYHIAHLHAGAQATLTALRQIYWPIAGRDAVRSILRKCINCFKVKPIINSEKMGDLPAVRLQQYRPFLKCGVDLCGPIIIKDGRGRKPKHVKVYIALFVCLSTKAVHLELISDLSTEGFLNALRRFISRRGTVSEIYSDNATNFVGSDRKLKQIFRNVLNKEALKSNLANMKVKWCFIPPKTPNFGGIWEANIKSAKLHLKKTIGDTILNYEEMHTLLVRIEACLNSRPLLPLTNDPNDLYPLTPGHFLIGAPLTAPVEEDLESTKLNRLTRWQHVEKMRQHFWRRWQREYVSQLQQRSKWRVKGPSSVKPGILVLLVEDDAPPLHWPLGRVQDVHPGKDGVVRVVTRHSRAAACCVCYNVVGTPMSLVRLCRRCVKEMLQLQVCSHPFDPVDP